MSGPAIFEIRSNEAGAFLRIERDPGRGPHADDLKDGYWHTTLSCGALRASLSFYEMGLDGFVEYIAELAASWRGWTGERRWNSLEGDVEIVATHDGHGTITLRARLRTETFSQHRWAATAELLLDAGGLDHLTRQAQVLL